MIQVSGISGTHTMELSFILFFWFFGKMNFSFGKMGIFEIIHFWEECKLRKMISTTNRLRFPILFPKQKIYSISHNGRMIQVPGVSGIHKMELCLIRNFWLLVKMSSCFAQNSISKKYPFLAGEQT